MTIIALLLSICMAAAFIWFFWTIVFFLIKWGAIALLFYLLYDALKDW